MAPNALHRPDWKNLLDALANRDTYLDVGLHLAEIVLICLVAMLLAAGGRALVRRTMKPLVDSELRRDRPAEAARHRTLASLLRSLVSYTIYILAIIGIIATLNVHVLGLMVASLGTAGIIGLVVGIGAQKLVRDIITGVFILMEDQYSVGDTVTIGTVNGVVEEVGIRVTRIRDDIGRLNLVPNGEISQVTNHSRGRLVATVELSVGPEQDLEAVREAVAATVPSGVENPEQNADSPLAGPAKVEGITALDGARVTLRITAPCLAGRQQQAEMAMRGQLKDKFQAAGIKLV